MSMGKFKKVMCAVLMSVVAVGCGSATADTQVDVVETGVIEIAEDEVAELPSASNPDGLTEEELSEELKGMVMAIDSLMMASVENGETVTANNPEKFWTVMHYALGNYAETYNRGEVMESELAVKSTDVVEFAAALTDGFNGLETMPASEEYGIRFDAETDTYFFGLGDRGLSQTEILSFEYTDMDTVKVSARLFALDDDSTICNADFTLVRNTNAGADAVFCFSVSEVNVMAE